MIYTRHQKLWGWTSKAGWNG